jgi:hypothetical protein
MGISPNHPNPPRRPEPPADNGERVATFDRGRGVELRVCLSEYEGYPYISLRVWERGPGGGFWPTRKGCSVRLSEAPELAAALAAVAGPGRVRSDPPQTVKRVGGERAGK